MLIDTRNPIVLHALDSVAKTVRAQGGWIHPLLTVHHEDERLWISCSDRLSNDPLIVIPDDLFIPVSQLDWQSIDGILSYSGDTSMLCGEQLSVLDAMVILYNATGKIKNVAMRLPCQQLPDDPELLEWLSIYRPGFTPACESPAKQFIETRLNRSGGTNSHGRLMPIIDMLNHHPDAPKYQRTESGAWLIPVNHPRPGSNECFVRYNKLDCLTLALGHGYFESGTRHTSALACQFHDDRLGIISILSTEAALEKTNAPIIKSLEDGLELSGIVLRPDGMAMLSVLLGLAIRAKLPNLDQRLAEKIATAMLQRIIEATILGYSTLKQLCSMPPPNESPLRHLLKCVATHQLDILAKTSTSLIGAQAS